MASRDAVESPRSAPRRTGAAAVPKDGGAESLLSPRFRSAAELAGWDEESVFAALIVEDTPVRESRRKRRSSTSATGGGGSTGSNTRKRRCRRQTTSVIPPVILSLDDDDDKPDNVALADGKKTVTEKADEKVAGVGEKEVPGSGGNADATAKLPCMDRLREELSCAICLDICFEPSTTPCGHSFCMKCLKHAAAKCGKRCPKCRQLISNSRSCTVNTVLWNTIQLLFPNEVEARRTSIASSSSCNNEANQSQARSGSFSQGGMRTRSITRSISGGVIAEGRTRSSHRTFVTSGIIREHGSTTSTNTSGSFIRAHASTRGGDSRRSFVPASQLITTRSSSSARSDQSDDAALAYRLQQEEFMNAFESEETHERMPQISVSAARDNLRAMASRAIRLRARGWPI